jgi:serine/threonine-protein kinase RsbT
MATQLPSEMPIRTEGDIVLVRRTAREAATQAGFSSTDVTRIVTASSELARNIFKYAGQGRMRWCTIVQGDRAGLLLEFQDDGPGIADIQLAMQEGYSSSGGLGMGLPGAKRLVDELEISSSAGQGTVVTLKKWLRHLQ